MNKKVYKRVVNINSTKMQVSSNYFSFKDFNEVTNVSDEDINKLLSDITEHYEKEKFDNYFNNAKEELLQNIIKPFGLAKFLFDDKDGGNVTTINNANKGIYAKEQDTYTREDYTNTKNNNGKQFAGSGKNSVGSNFTKSKMDSNGNVKDAYTGKIQKADTTSPDHIESLSQHHKNGGFMQDKTKKANFATDKDNLAITDRSINQSMRDYDKKDWKEKKTEKNIKNKHKYNIDEKELNKQINQGKETSRKHLPTDIEKIQYYSKNIASTGLKEGAKMGMQQALGLFLQEFIKALFEQAQDIYYHSFKKNIDDTFFQTIKIRFQEIANKILSKWKDILNAFKDGAISGFISNMVTVIINIFETTMKRVVRFIREGILSLFKAVKYIMNPPENMTKIQAYHEASKILASGILIGVGIVIEEAVNKFLSTNLVFLENFAGININEILSTLLVGSTITILTGLVIFLIDKIDLFGVEADKKYEFIINKLDLMCSEDIQKINNNYDEVMNIYK
jgi:hypothetical protein